MIRLLIALLTDQDLETEEEAKIQLINREKAANRSL